MNRTVQRLSCTFVLVLLSSCISRPEQMTEDRVSAFLSLVGSCAEYVETGSLDAFSNLTEVPIEPQDCSLDCEFGSAKYVSPRAPDAGYLRVLSPDPSTSITKATEVGVAAMPVSTRCLIKPADNLGRTPGSELNNAVQMARQTALETGRIFPSDRDHYWNDGCGYNGLAYSVETITLGVQNSDAKILHFVQFHFPGTYYSGRFGPHGYPLDPVETRTCEEVGF